MEDMTQIVKQLLENNFDNNQSEFARYMNVSPQAVQKWIAGETEPGKKNRKKILAIPIKPKVYSSSSSQAGNAGLHVSQPFQAYGSESGKGRVIALHPEDQLPEGMISIKQSNVHFSAGNGREASYEIIEESEPATYQLSWFQKEKINPKNVRRFKVTGNSQEPMLFDGDSVLVNLSETNIVDGKLYAIRYGNDLRVKFLSRKIDGTLILRSMNKEEYPDEEVPPDLAAEQITVVGRVRDKSGKGGL